MPQRQLSPEEWSATVRRVLDAQHALATAQGYAGTDLDTRQYVRALDEVVKALGWDPAVDPMPPSVS